jgi:hypothetical protein
MILGMPWLRHYNPIIDWEDRSMELRSKGDKSGPASEKKLDQHPNKDMRSKDTVALAVHLDPKGKGKKQAGSPKKRS